MPVCYVFIPLLDMKQLFKFHGDGIHYEFLVSYPSKRIISLHQELVRSDDVLYLRMSKFVDALILAQLDFDFRVIFDLPY